jgi:ornithine carbamoyltransferase
MKRSVTRKTNLRFPALKKLDRSGLSGRSLRTLRDLSDGELRYLVTLAHELKQRKRAGIRGDLLDRKNIAMIFEKASTRTRSAAAVAIADEGGHAEYLSAREIHLGKKESVADTAKVLGRMFDGILFRGYRQDTVELLARFAGVPVWNGLTDDAHPTQTLADLQTIEEKFGRLKGLRVVYMGDGRNNVATSLMLGCAKSGMHFVDCTPPELYPTEELVAEARATAERNQATIEVECDPATAVKGANVVYTDVWASMGEEAEMSLRIRLLTPYQVTMKLMETTGNVGGGRVIFLHCLPAFHDRHTEVGKETGAMEVTNEVFDAPFSLVFEQSENRVHTMKAVFVATLAQKLRNGSGGCRPSPQ